MSLISFIKSVGYNLFQCQVCGELQGWREPKQLSAAKKTTYYLILLNLNVSLRSHLAVIDFLFLAGHVSGRNRASPHTWRRGFLLQIHSEGVVGCLTLQNQVIIKICNEGTQSLFFEGILRNPPLRESMCPKIYIAFSLIHIFQIALWVTIGLMTCSIFCGLKSTKLKATAVFLLQVSWSVTWSLPPDMPTMFLRDRLARVAC